MGLSPRGEVSVALAGEGVHSSCLTSSGFPLPQILPTKVEREELCLCWGWPMSILAASFGETRVLTMQKTQLRCTTSLLPQGGVPRLQCKSHSLRTNLSPEEVAGTSSFVSPPVDCSQNRGRCYIKPCDSSWIRTRHVALVCLSHRVTLEVLASSPWYGHIETDKVNHFYMQMIWEVMFLRNTRSLVRKPLSTLRKSPKLVDHWCLYELTGILKKREHILLNIKQKTVCIIIF